MRRSATALIGVLMLAACSAAVKGESPYAQGIDAFREGDRATLAASIQTLGAEAAVNGDACTSDALAAERSRIERSMLEYLDRSPLFSMSEEARLVYLSSAFINADLTNGGDLGSEDCRGRADASLLLSHGLKKAEIFKVVNRASIAWREELAIRYGGELDSRMTSARHLLQMNHLDGSA